VCVEHRKSPPSLSCAPRVGVVMVLFPPCLMQVQVPVRGAPGGGRCAVRTPPNISHPICFPISHPIRVISIDAAPPLICAICQDHSQAYLLSYHLSYALPCLISRLLFHLLYHTSYPDSQSSLLHTSVPISCHRLTAHLQAALLKSLEYGDPHLNLLSSYPPLPSPDPPPALRRPPALSESPPTSRSLSAAGPPLEVCSLEYSASLQGGGASGQEGASLQYQASGGGQGGIGGYMG
jgi:hypothetical protein